jgi:hypothetical protein
MCSDALHIAELEKDHGADFQLIKSSEPLNAHFLSVDFETRHTP